jgi:hypothetical protein
MSIFSTNASWEETIESTEHNAKRTGVDNTTGENVARNIWCESQRPNDHENIRHPEYKHETKRSAVEATEAT